MNSIVVHYQEIALKGKNRPWFIARLVRNIRHATADLDVRAVRPLMGRLELVLGPAATYEQVRERLVRVFGIANFSLAGARAARHRGDRRRDPERPGRPASRSRSACPCSGPTSASR